MTSSRTSLAERNLPGVNPEDALPAPNVRCVHHDLAVEPARAEQRRIEHVGPVGSGHQDDSVVRLEAIHLDQQLIEGLLPLVVSAAEPGAPVPPDGVDLVDEDDAGRVRLTLLEEIAHPAGADAHEHLDEVRAGHREEGPAGLAGDRLGQQRLAGSRRSHQQRPLGQPTAQPGELLGVLQELDDFLQLDLGFIGPGHVGEGHLGRVAGEELGFGLPEGKRPAAARLELAQQEEPEAENDDPGERGDDDGRDAALGLLGQDGDVGLLQPLDEGFAVGHREQHLEALGAPAVLGHRDS